MKKYKFTKETLQFFGRTLHRIVATRSFGNIKKGDLGGWVENENNLSHEGNCWVSGDAMVYDNALVSGDAWVSGNAMVYGRAWVCGDALVCGGARVFDNAWVSGDAWVSGNAMVYGGAWVCGGARVFDNARVYGRAWVSGDAEVYGLASVFENARVWGNSQVNGTTQLTEDLYTEKTVEKLKETSGNLTEENTRLHQEVEILKTKLQTVLDIITK